MKVKNTRRGIFLVAVLVAVLTACNQQIVTNYDEAKHILSTEVEHPEWTESAIIYEVNIRQFSEEGTLAALEEQLPRLHDLGVDILWLMPVNPIGEKNRKGSLGSYYSIRDYRSVNPEFGTTEDLEELVKEAHGLDMYVILDWVTNHTAWDNSLLTEHPEWYKKDSLGNFVSPYDWTDVVELDYDNKELREYMIESMKYWVTETDMDGFRCDVAGLVPCDFWTEARTALDEVKPVFMLAENEDEDCLVEKAFDMNYGWKFHHLLNQVSQGSKTVSDLKDFFHKEDSIYDPSIIKMNFITNHDENSWNGTEFERMGDYVEACALMAYTVPGMPLIYTGQEAGLEKRLKFYEKDAVEWPEKSEWTSFYKKLNKLRHEHSCFYSGEARGDFIVTVNESHPDLLIYQRMNDDDNFVVAVNFGKEKDSFRLKSLGIKGDYQNYFTSEPLDDETELSLAPAEYLLLIEDF